MGLPFLLLAFLLCCTVSSVPPCEGRRGMRIVETVYRGQLLRLKFHRVRLGWVCFHSCALEEHVASRLKTHSFSSGKVSWSLFFFFFFFSTVLSVFSLKCFLKHMLGLLDYFSSFFFSYFPSHLLAVFLVDVLSLSYQLLLRFSFMLLSCFPRFLLCSEFSDFLFYFMVVILSNGICFSCNISFLQVVYFGFSLIIKGFLRYLAGEPWLSAHL